MNSIAPVIVERRKVFSYPHKHTMFRPSTAYPEYAFPEDISSEENAVYDMVRSTFVRAGYDKEHFGGANWNPLTGIIKPGDSILIKPNFVMDINPSGDGVECLYTQPAVIAPVIDYVLLALGKSSGRIVIGDAPMQECNFEKLVHESGLSDLIQYYKSKGVTIELVDFRELSSVVEHGIHKATINENAKGTVINIGDESEFSGLAKEKFKKMRVTNYDPRILVTHHQPGKNEYYVSDYLLNADVVINMPKPKSHRKAGVTIALKNMVGINVRKEYLPHHTVGDKNTGSGDEYLSYSLIKTMLAIGSDKINILIAEHKYGRAQLFRVYNALLRRVPRPFASDQYSEGSWYGNETISKTIVDLNKILFYADKHGEMQEIQQRKYLIVADMIQSGEKEGPVRPSRKDAGIIAIGCEPVCFDECIASLMGVNAEKIPVLRCAKKSTSRYRIPDSDKQGMIFSNEKKWDQKHNCEIPFEDSLLFYPTSGWLPAFYSTNGAMKTSRDITK